MVKKEKVFPSLGFSAIVFFLLILPPFIISANNNESDEKLPTPNERILVRLTNNLSESSSFEAGEKLIQSFLKRNRINGATVSVMHKGKLVYAKGFGYGDVEKEEEVEPYHIFRIASASKWVTALGIMKLVQEEKLSLDDYVFADSAWLANEPYTEVMKDPNYNRVQIKHLLYHTAGWNSNVMGDPMFKPTEYAKRIGHKGEITQDDIFAFSLYYKLPYRPGTRYSYSNVGYAFLGRIIEKASGMGYEEYIKSEILTPLGIKDMRLTVKSPDQKSFPEVEYYDHDGENVRSNAYGLEGKASRIYEGTHYDALEGAGAWAASPSDLLKLLAASDGDDRMPDFLRKDIVEQMITPTNPGNSFIGWVDVNEDQWKRTGTLIGTNTLLMRYNEDISYCIVTNTSTWKGGRTNTELQWLMSQFVKSVDEWPEHNLFHYYELDPVQTVSNLGFKGLSVETF
ncbi:serine hydrolase domain-containing protein [Peijinzhouia sedimentorum]